MVSLAGGWYRQVFAGGWQGWEPGRHLTLVVLRRLHSVSQQHAQHHILEGQVPALRAEAGRLPCVWFAHSSAGCRAGRTQGRVPLLCSSGPRRPYRIPAAPWNVAAPTYDMRASKGCAAPAAPEPGRGGLGLLQEQVGRAHGVVGHVSGQDQPPPAAAEVLLGAAGQVGRVNSSIACTQ